MPNNFKQLRLSCILSAILTLSACANQPPSPQEEEDAPQVPHPIASLETPVEYRPLPADTMYALLVAEFAGSRNRYEIAVSNYVQQAQLTRDPGVTARAARIARLLNAQEAALEMALLWLELEPHSSEAHFIAGAEFARAGELIKAAEHSAILLDQGEEGFFEAIAASAAHDNDTTVALELQEKYAELLQRHPDSASLHLGQSLLLHMAGDLEPALEAARRAAELNPDDYQAGLQEMRILQQMGKTEQAEQGMARLVEQYPDNQRLRLQYARMLAHSDLAEAQSQFKTLIEQSPGDPDFTFSLGLIQLERGLLAEAASQFRSLTGGDEHNDSAHYYLGKIAEQRGDQDAALHHYQQVRDGNDYLPAVMQAAEILVEKGDADGAVNYLRRERARADTKFRDGLYVLEAEVMSETRGQQEALEVLNAGLAQSPESNRLLYARAMRLVEADRLPEAERDLKKVIELTPNNAAALNALGYTLADNTNRLEEALDYISAALSLAPDDASILDSMGWVQYRLGNHDEALDYLRRAMADTPDHEIAAHLGEVLWVTGDQQEARDIWRAGLELNPKSSVIRNTLERFNVDLSGNQ